jgi:L-amino acid N-acyltransferase YncA
MRSGVEGTVGLRPAGREDCRLLWELRNDPETREASFKTDPIPFEDHQRWFEAKLDSAEIRIFIVQDPSGRGIGYVRFHLEGETA